ncbi:hypothetical protein SDC9_173682 [bioreactor metagenome]|uniref:Uncharacterized protein n=1 Tax=bioreactor metagenome TaxID=1076179 RepID=A0A645GH48_9ZZZZ
MILRACTGNPDTVHDIEISVASKPTGTVIETLLPVVEDGVRLLAVQETVIDSGIFALTQYSVIVLASVTTPLLDCANVGGDAII